MITLTDAEQRQWAVSGLSHHAHAYWEVKALGNAEPQRCGMPNIRKLVRLITKALA